MRSSNQMPALEMTDLDLVCTKLGYDWNSRKSVRSLLIGEQSTMDELVHLAQQRGEAFLADPRSARCSWTTIQQREKTVYNEAVEDCLIGSPAGGWELLSEGASCPSHRISGTEVLIKQPCAGEGPLNRPSDLPVRFKLEKGVKQDGSTR